MDIFAKQVEVGIIEKIPAGFDYTKHIWIPHRAVIKTAPAVIIKVRPVFNCSLKTGGSPSLSEAAYEKLI